MCTRWPFKLFYLASGILLLLSIGVIANGNREQFDQFLNEDKEIHTEYVDPNNDTLLAMFNVTRDELNQKFASNKINNNDSINGTHNPYYIEQIKEHRINDIRYRLKSAIQAARNSEESPADPQQLLQEMAAYPMCSGTEVNDSTWLEENNVTIRFSDSLFEPKRERLSVDSALLRLYKINPNGTNVESTEPVAKACNEPVLDAQIRVTVSIMQQFRRNKREKKKRICNTKMMNYSKTGWIEIDIKRAIHIWENAEQQQQQHHQQQQQQQQQHRVQQARQQILVGWLLIEVHDEEERPLKPGLFFSPPKCDQAGDLAIPWNYNRSTPSMSPHKKDQMPRYPRLDVKLSAS